MSSVPTISDIFNCCICLNKLVNAHLCPKCSKMFCFECIKCWIDNSKKSCPNCRGSLKMDKLVRLRGIDEAIELLNNPNNIPVNETCTVHKKLKEIYCNTCSVPICDKCEVFSDEHTKHEVKPLVVVFTEIKNLTNDKLVSLREKIDMLAKQSDKITHQTEHQINVIQDELDNVKSIYLENIEKLKLKLEDSRNNIRDNINRSTTLMYKIESKLQTFTHYQLVEEAPQIDEHVKQMLEVPLEDIKPFHSEFIPPYDTKDFTLTNFSDAKIADKVVYSDLLLSDGICWRLEVYPNGYRDARGNFLSLFIELNCSLSQSHSFNCKIELINKDETKNITKTFTNKFVVNDCWGYRNYYDLDFLESDGFILNDSIKIKMSVRSPTYCQKYNILKDNFLPSEAGSYILDNSLKKTNITTDAADNICRTEILDQQMVSNRSDDVHSVEPSELN